VRFAVPDIDLQRAFLKDFGLIETGESEGAIYFRAAGPAPYCYVLTQGEPAFLGFGVWARDMEDLAAIASHDGAEIQASAAPGGGSFVRLVDPDGVEVDVVAGQDMAEPLAAEDPLPWNEGSKRLSRISTFRRSSTRPSTVQRLGHVVINVSDFRTSEKWYKDRFGVLTSDEVQPAPGVAIGAFMRADRGEEPTDHHMIVCFQTGGPAGFMHAAFEAAGVDDLMVGHDYLASKGHKANWGIGRHILGSQVFDYWSDPYGHEVEHWTDGDQLKASDGSGAAGMDVVLGVQWGMKMPNPPGAPGE
tara:strand:- start:26907 stop:27815 length:909 start_codon:yes stop_codon:yes gene_type:complete